MRKYQLNIIRNIIVEDQNLSKDEKEKKGNMVVNLTKVFQKMKK